MVKKKRLFGPSIASKEIKYVSKAAAKGWFDNSTFFQREFENKLKKIFRRKYAVLTSNGTHAIHLALAANDIGAGDEVIVPNCTWIATCSPVVQTGAKIVFADIEKESWCISVKSILKSITKKTKAIISVDLYGNMPDYDKLVKICKSKKIILIEDAAESIGSFYKNRPAGSFGDCSIFSFHGTKIITTGEGGVLLTNNSNLFNRASMLGDHGRYRNKTRVSNIEIAYKYQMSAMQAAMGTVQISRLSGLLKKKRKIYLWYKKYLGKYNFLTLNTESKFFKSNFWLITIVWDPKLKKNINQFIDFLSKNNIESRPFFEPLSDSLAFKKKRKCFTLYDQNKVSKDISSRSINIPSSVHLTETDIKKISKKIVEFLLNE